MSSCPWSGKKDKDGKPPCEECISVSASEQIRTILTFVRERSMLGNHKGQLNRSMAWIHTSSAIGQALVPL